MITQALARLSFSFYIGSAGAKINNDMKSPRRENNPTHSHTSIIIIGIPTNKDKNNNPKEIKVSGKHIDNIHTGKSALKNILTSIS